MLVSMELKISSRPYELLEKTIVMDFHSHSVYNWWGFIAEHLLQAQTTKVDNRGKWFVELRGKNVFALNTPLKK